MTQTPVRQLRVPWRIHALSVGAPAPAMEVATKTVRRDMRQGEIAAEMWTAIRHCMGAPVEVSIQHNPARAELDVLNVAFPELSG